MKTHDHNVAIIVLNWNGGDDTLACLESLLDLEFSPFSVWICDNASSDGSPARISAWAVDRLPILNRKRAERGRTTLEFAEFEAGAARGPGSDWRAPTRAGVFLVHTGANLGFAGGNNVGLKYALRGDFDLFWLLNNDTEVDHEALTHLVARMDEDSRIGMCGSTLVYASRPDVVQNLGGGGFRPFRGKGYALGGGAPRDAPVDREAIEKSMAFVSGASMLVSRAFLETVGLMSEDYFLYFEEPDWAERARGRFKLGFAPNSVVRHKVGASIGTDDFGNSSPLSIYYLTRNRIKFCWRFYRQALPLVYLELARDILQAFLRRDWARAKLLLRSTFGFSFAA